jgi:hypothetical protein
MFIERKRCVKFKDEFGRKGPKTGWSRVGKEAVVVV